MAPAPFVLSARASLHALCKQFGVRQLDLFGSATDERFDPARSDLDFLVAFEDLPEGTYADAYFGLRDALAGLFGREVDLVTEPALRNPYLRRQIEAHRQRVFPAE
ncbi:MAG: nucleotidyltransferase domain-containing protein [Pseudomonadota bacterium]|nr:nucleotidyltransferase domain-containing protein [Pseudomonadota bacterium]